MNFSHRWFIAPVLLLILISASRGYAVDLGNPLFHSGITKSGHSGLLFTKGGTAIIPGKIFLGILPDYFDRDLPGNEREKKLTIPLTFTYGFPKVNHLEFAAKIPFVSRDNETSDSGISEADLSLKWSFLQQEENPFPSMGAGFATRFALADGDKGLSDIDEYGLVFFLSGTALIDLVPYSNYAFSLYGDVELVLNDWGRDREEKHGEFNVGALLPVPNYRNLGFILEFGGTVNRGTSKDRDFIRIAPAFRANYRKFTFTIGTSFVNPELSGADTYVEYTLSAVIGL
jgi:hypothetical protein